MAKKKIAKRTASTSIASIKKQIANEAAAAKDLTSSTLGNKIKITQDKQFQLPDGTKRRDPLRLVIVDYAAQNHLYEGKFVPDNPTPPVCMAISKPASLKGRIKDMVPLDSSPKKMNDDCETCPMNKFDTNDRGGKACKNIQKLAVLAAADEYDETEPLNFIEVSPSALKGYDSFINRLSARDIIPIMVVTEVNFDDSKDHPCLTFKEVAPNPHVEYHWNRRPEAQLLVTQGPDMTRTPEAKPKAKRKTKAVAKKKSSRRKVA